MQLLILAICVTLLTWVSGFSLKLRRVGTPVIRDVVTRLLAVTEVGSCKESLFPLLYVVSVCSFSIDCLTVPVLCFILSNILLFLCCLRY